MSGTYNPNTVETWIHATGNRPIKLGDDIYFIKTRKMNHRVNVVIPYLAVEELGLQTETAYIIHMKSISTGQVFDEPVVLKRATYKQEQNCWPMCGELSKHTKVEPGYKFYAQIKRANMDGWFTGMEEELLEWFNNGKEEPSNIFW